MPLDDAVGFGALLGGNDDLGTGGDERPLMSIVFFPLVDIKSQGAISRRDKLGARLPALNRVYLCPSRVLPVFNDITMGVSRYPNIAPTLGLFHPSL